MDWSDENIRASWTGQDRLRTLNERSERNHHLHSIITVGDLLNVKQCDALIEAALGLASRPGVSAEGRGRAVVERPLPADEAIWPWGNVLSTIADVNSQYFRFRVSHMVFENDVPRFLEYRSADNARYNTHLDIGPDAAANRKLSWTLQLSNEDDYDGGEVVMAQAPESPLSRAQGSLSVFPSYLSHAVEPVTRGVRYSVVGWCHGPSFS
jgi:PKHD-type hydroxylase